MCFFMNPSWRPNQFESEKPRPIAKYFWCDVDIFQAKPPFTAQRLVSLAEIVEREIVTERGR